MLQSNSRIFKFSLFFMCLLIVTPTENSSPAPLCLGTLAAFWMRVFIVSLPDYRIISSSVYEGRQTLWPAQELHILSVRKLQRWDVSPGEAQPCPVGQRRAGAMLGVGAAAPLRSPLPPAACAELMERLRLCSHIPADVPLPALGSRLSALPLNPKSWMKHTCTFLHRKRSLLM